MKMKDQLLGFIFHLLCGKMWGWSLLKLIVVEQLAHVHF